MPRCRSLPCEADQLSGSPFTFLGIHCHTSLSRDFHAGCRSLACVGSSSPVAPCHLQVWDMQVSFLVTAADCLAMHTHPHGLLNHLHLRNRQPQLQLHRFAVHLTDCKAGLRRRKASARYMGDHVPSTCHYDSTTRSDRAVMILFSPKMALDKDFAWGTVGV